MKIYVPFFNNILPKLVLFLSSIFLFFGCRCISYHSFCLQPEIIRGTGILEQLELFTSFPIANAKIDSLFLESPVLFPKSDKENKMDVKFKLHSFGEDRDYMLFIPSDSSFVYLNISSYGKKLIMDIRKKIKLTKTDKFKDSIIPNNCVIINSENEIYYFTYNGISPCEMSFSENEYIIMYVKEQVLKKLNIKYATWRW